MNYLTQHNRKTLRSFFLLFAVFWFLGNYDAQAQTNLGPVADTDSQSDNSAGTNPALSASQWNHLFIKFDLSNISGSVSQATFRIYKNDTHAFKLEASTTSIDNWMEGTTKPSKGSLITSVNVPAGPAGYVEVNLTSFVQQRMSSNKIVSITLTTDLGNWTNFNSRQASSNRPQLIVVSSSSSTLTVDPTSLNFSSAAGSNTFSINSNTSWSVTKNQSWISVSPTSGSNNGTVTVSVTSNTESSSRSGSVTVTGGGITRTVSISQAGADQGSGTGLRAEYFNNMTLTSPSVLTKTDATLDFNWGTGSPATGTVNIDYFSVRWTGKVQAPVTGNYTFSTVSDDGVRLWINGNQVINNWTNHAPTTDNSSIISLTAGQQYDIRMEYYENAGGAVARLLWTYPGQSQQIIPQSRLYPSTITPTLTVNPTSLNFSSAAGSNSISITSNTSWSVTKNQSWISISPTSGSNHGTVTASVTANTGTSSRSGTITVTGGGITRNVSVSQAASSGSASMILGTNFWNFGWGNGRADYFNSGIDWNTVSNPWRQKLLDELSIYKVIRFMDQVPTNSSNVVNWSERVAKTANHNTTSNGAVAYEWQVDLCNRLGADIWITVPHRTIESYEANPSSNYWTQLANLLKSQLNSNINIYVEYSNETWSGGSSFTQGDYSADRGVQMGFDPDRYTAKFYFHVYAAMRLHKVFQDAFAGQTHRIKTVIAGQDGSLWGTQQQMLALNNQTNSQGPKPALNPWNLTPTHYTIANYIDTGNGAASNIRQAWTDKLASAAQYYQQVVNTISPKGMELIAYEGGQHYTNNAHIFSQNPESYNMYLEWLNVIKNYFKITCHYTHVGSWSSGGAWGAKASTDQSINDAHRYRALRDWVNGTTSARIAGNDSLIEDIKLDDKILIYPNPIENNNITIDFNDFILKGNTSIEFTDTSGRKTIQKINLDGSSTINVIVPQLNKGLYNITIRNGGHVIQKKVMVK